MALFFCILLLLYPAFHLFLLMDAKNIQSQCEAFLKSLPFPAFLVIGLQTGPEKVDLVYSLNNMPMKAAVKGLAKTLDDVASKL